jgi:hypothetical protein
VVGQMIRGHHDELHIGGFQCIVQIGCIFLGGFHLGVAMWTRAWGVMINDLWGFKINIMSIKDSLKISTNCTSSRPNS